MTMTKRPAPDLRHYTSARVALGRAGSALATREVLDFQLAHAQARDAVHATLDVDSLLDGLRRRNLPCCALKSAAPDRTTYLRHPDLGRRLAPKSTAELGAAACDLVFVIVDGLSALAVNRHALALLDATLPLLDRNSWSIAPVCVVEQGRVAIGDSIGAALGARTSVVLIGERPGLSSPDSLGIYVTWSPRPGRTDAERNCISNIRPEGLGYAAAANVLAFYLHESRYQKLTGVALKLEHSAILPSETSKPAKPQAPK
ncbi:MAG TPA: ethanolamine ammonia-lyase subunit EutC [Terriglobales bacterium]|nr:ethanolamine ammonia-lyase subunit EutC [Terriglobales bacterium]